MESESVVATRGDGQWFAVQAWAGREHLAADHLLRRYHEVFLPCYVEYRQWSDRLKKVERALFPGYLFSRASAATIGKIVTAPGVIRIVGDRHGPQPVAAHEIEMLQRAIERGVAAEPWEFLESGDRVRIHAGPLCGAEGTVVRTNRRQRLVLSVTLLRRSVALELDPAWVTVPSSVWLDRALPSAAQDVIVGH